MNGVTTPSDVTRICIPNSCFYRNNEYGQNSDSEYLDIEYGETVTYDKTANTAQDTAFCVLVIDKAASKVYAVHYGAGYDRQMAMYLIRKLTNLSLPDIGKEFGRDHSTVLYAIRKVEVALKNGDSNVQNNVRDITANINSCL